MAAWSDGPRLFAHFRDLAEPLRLADLPAYVQALGFSSDLMSSKTLRAHRCGHRDAYVGNFFLGESRRPGIHQRRREGPDAVRFPGCDRDRQRPHARAERRARADLEALVETSPVSVVVFDGGTGELATPIQAAAGAVESFVITLQDLAPLEGDRAAARRVSGSSTSRPIGCTA